jgi:hypothetical protein
LLAAVSKCLCCHANFAGFRDFILRGNVVDLAVAIVVGTSFTALVNALVSARQWEQVTVHDAPTPGWETQPTNTTVRAAPAHGLLQVADWLTPFIAVIFKCATSAGRARASLPTWRNPPNPCSLRLPHAARLLPCMLLCCCRPEEVFGALTFTINGSIFNYG